MEVILILSGFAYITLILFLLTGLSQSKIKYNGNPVPISIIVAAHNEAGNILPCLQALAAQNYPPDFYEIIIVDDRSGDETFHLASDFAKSYPAVRIIQINDQVEGFSPKKRAIATAIQQAKYSFLAFTDADGRPGPGWLSTISAHYSAGADMILGYAPYLISDKSSLMGEMLALEYLSHQAIAAATANLGFPATCVGTNMAYRKQIFNDLQGFGRFKHVQSGDDDLFLNLARETGKYKIVYMTNPDSHVFNAPPKSLSAFIQQRIRYASKGFRYQIGLVIPLLLFVFFNILILAGIWLSPIYTMFTFILKFIADGLFLRKAGIVLGDRRSFSVYPLTAFLHIPYVIFFSILGQLLNYKWGN